MEKFIIRFLLRRVTDHQTRLEVLCETCEAWFNEITDPILKIVDGYSDPNVLESLRPALRELHHQSIRSNAGNMIFNILEQKGLNDPFFQPCQSLKESLSNYLMAGDLLKTVCEPNIVANLSHQEQCQELKKKYAQFSIYKDAAVHEINKELRRISLG